MSDKHGLTSELKQLLLNCSWNTFTEWLYATQLRDYVLAECDFNFDEDELTNQINLIKDREMIGRMWEDFPKEGLSATEVGIKFHQAVEEQFKS